MCFMVSPEVRLLVAKSYLANTEGLLRNLGNEKAHVVLGFLKRYACTIFPKEPRGSFAPGESLSPLQFILSNVLVWVYVFYEEDFDLLLPAAVESLGLQDSNQCGCYHPANRFLVVSGNRGYSPFFSGLLFLHEGFHAYVHQIEFPGQIFNADEHEYDTQCFEHAWLLEYGGDTFRAVLAGRKHFILGQLAGRPLGEYHPATTPPYPVLLDDFMGLPANPAECKSRNYLVHLHAFHALLQESSLSRTERIRIAARFSRF